MLGSRLLVTGLMSVLLSGASLALEPCPTEEGVDAGNEKRSWRWLLEGDVDADGFDHKGEKAAFWMFLRLGIDRGGPADGEKGEDVDLNGFGICVWGAEEE